MGFLIKKPMKCSRSFTKLLTNWRYEMLQVKCKGANPKLIEKARDMLSGVRKVDWFKTQNGLANVAKVGQRHRLVHNIRNNEYLFVTMEQYNKLIGRL